MLLAGRSVMLRQTKRTSVLGRALSSLDGQGNWISVPYGGGFADFALPRRGGYYLSRKVAREVMGVDGHWSVEPD
mgnify:CR=1 FL=1